MYTARMAGTALLATAALAATTTGPAFAAFPVTDFPHMTNSSGSADVKVTWLNRSVQVGGLFADNTSDSVTTVVCVDGFTGPNATGAQVNVSIDTCRGINGRPSKLDFTISYDFPGGIQSTRVWIGRQAASGEYIGFDDFRTRNRPPA